MLRRTCWLSSVFASLALIALLEASVVQAGPSSGGRSYQSRVGADYSYSNSAPVYSAPVRPAPAPIAGDFNPLYNPQPVFYAYYAPAVRRSTAGGEEEAEQNATASIEMTVPANAEVWLDGQKSQQTGTARAFVTPPLERGQTFRYDLRVRWTAPGDIVVDVTRPIQVQGGRQTTVGFRQ